MSTHPMIMKSAFTLAYFPKCTKQSRLYNHLLPLIPSTECCTRTRSKLLNASLVSPCVKYDTALSVSIVGRYLAQGDPLPHHLYAGLLSQAKPTGWVPC